MSTTESTLAKRIEQEITTLQARADAIIVRDQQSYVDACQFVVEGRAKIKGVGFELDPGIAAARNTLDLLRNQKTKWVERYQIPTETVAKKAEAWKTEERRQAQAEQDRINAENRRKAAQQAEDERRVAEKEAKETRKAHVAEIRALLKAGTIGKRQAAQLLKDAGAVEEAAKASAAAAADEAAANPPTVQVAPAVPKVSGIKARVNWKFEITNPALIPATFRIPDEVAIGQMVRSMKDKASAEKQCPGIRVWTEDGI